MSDIDALFEDAPNHVHGATNMIEFLALGENKTNPVLPNNEPDDNSDNDVDIDQAVLDEAEMKGDAAMGRMRVVLAEETIPDKLEFWNGAVHNAVQIQHICANNHMTMLISMRGAMPKERAKAIAAASNSTRTDKDLVTLDFYEMYQPTRNFALAHEIQKYGVSQEHWWKCARDFNDNPKFTQKWLPVNGFRPSYDAEDLHAKHANIYKTKVEPLLKLLEKKCKTNGVTLISAFQIESADSSTPRKHGVNVTGSPRMYNVKQAMMLEVLNLGFCKMVILPLREAGGKMYYTVQKLIAEEEEEKKKQLKEKAKESKKTEAKLARDMEKQLWSKESYGEEAEGGGKKKKSKSKKTKKVKHDAVHNMAAADSDGEAEMEQNSIDLEAPSEGEQEDGEENGLTEKQKRKAAKKERKRLKKEAKKRRKLENGEHTTDEAGAADIQDDTDAISVHTDQDVEMGTEPVALQSDNEEADVPIATKKKRKRKAVDSDDEEQDSDEKQIPNNNQTTTSEPQPKPISMKTMLEEVLAKRAHEQASEDKRPPSPLRPDCPDEALYPDQDEELI